MEVTGIGNITPATYIGSAQPYRRHIVGLPLQRSLFGLAARVAGTIGFPSLSSQSDFPARIDENGDLFLDRSRVAAISKALFSWFTVEALGRMHSTHAAACNGLMEASENAALVRTLGDSKSIKLAEDLANRMALVLAYGVLSKFVPDVLLRVLSESGDSEPPPFPDKSAGAELMQQTFALHQACCALDYSPRRLQEEWPRVPPEVFELVNAFCHQQTGFGRLAWDSPGYEDPDFVIRLLHSAFDEIDAQLLRQRLSLAKRGGATRSAASRGTKIEALRRVLGFWLDFLERETWYVRRAFYIGMIPLLRRIAEEQRRRMPEFQPADLLFLEIDELTAGAFDLAVIQKRQKRYLANGEYLSLHGVDAARLATIVGTS
jgi:hypothetical protein